MLLRIFKSLTLLIGGLVCVWILFFLVAKALLHNSPQSRFGRAYRQLKIGLTQDEVRTLFGGTPDYECQFKSSQIWYFKAPDSAILPIRTKPIEHEPNEMFESIDDLPDVYDYVQLAFDSEGTLHAYTWIGETYTVETKNGAIDGASFTKLSPADF